MRLAPIKKLIRYTLPQHGPNLIGDLDVASQGFVSDPYPIYSELRRHAPLKPLSGGGYLLCRHADIAAALTDRRFGNSPSRFSVLHPRNACRYPAAAVASRIPPFLDMPGHRLPRTALSRCFYSALTGFHEVIERLAVAHATGRAGRFDIIPTIVSPFACETMIKFVGLDLSVDRLKALASAFFSLFAPIQDKGTFATLNRELEEGRERVRKSVDQRRRHAASDLISGLLAYQEQFSSLTDDCIIDLAILVAADGVENIEAAVALVLRRILSDSDLARRSLEPDRLDSVVREALRLETPAQIIPRVAREALTLHGQEIGVGTPVFLALGSANRDPDAFLQPDKFGESRTGCPALTFGLGRHRCVGEPLAIMMIGAMVRALLARGARQSRADRRYAFETRFGHRWPKAAMFNVSFA